MTDWIDGVLVDTTLGEAADRSRLSLDWIDEALLDRPVETLPQSTPEERKVHATREIERRDPIATPPSEAPQPGGGLVDLVTGSGRQTRATEDLPSLADVGLKSVLGDIPPARRAAVTAALATTFDDREFVDILKANSALPISEATDEAGNTVLQVGDGLVLLNRPGFSVLDGIRLGANAALFTPFGRSTATGARGVLSVAGKEAAVEAGIQAAQAATGGDFSGLDVAIAGAGAGAFEALGRRLARRFPDLADPTDRMVMTNETREVIRREAIQMGFDREDLTDDVVDGLVDQVRARVRPEQALAIQGEREFRVPLTQAERALDDAGLSFEDRARSGMLGGRAQRTMREFETEQQLPAIARATEEIQDRFGPRVGQAEAGAVVREGVQAAERAADDAVQAAYEGVGDAALDSDGVLRLLRATRRAVLGIDNDRQLKSTAGLLDAIRKQERAQRLPGVKAQPLQRLEQFRRRINTAIGAAENASDKRQLTQMKRAFDDYLDDAVVRHLFQGDEEALSALKESRGLFREYARKFRANPTKTRSGRTIQDLEGNFIERMIEANPTDEQVINAVFGASNFSNLAGANMAKRFKAILGEDSEGWAAIRQAGFDRLLKYNRVNNREILSASKSQTELFRALGKNKSLMRELYTEDELALFRRFFAHIKRTQPDLLRSRENPSGTAQAAIKTLTDFATRIAAALSGDFSLLLTSRGLEAASGVRSATRASRSVRPFAEVLQPRRIIPASGAAAATGVAAELEE